MKNATLLTTLIFTILQISYSQSETDFINFDSPWNINTSVGLGQAQTTKYRFDGDSIVTNSNRNTIV